LAFDERKMVTENGAQVKIFKYNSLILFSVY